MAEANRDDDDDDEISILPFHSVISLCIEAVQSLLYPFVWQHTLVPVLPKAMNEISSAPTPYILGVLSENVDDWRAITPDEVKMKPPSLSPSTYMEIGCIA